MSEAKEHEAQRTIRCSFCGRSKDSVRHMCEGPNEIRICNECVDLCAELIREDTNRILQENSHA